MHRFFQSGAPRTGQGIMVWVLCLGALALSLAPAPHARAAAAANSIIGTQATASYVDSTGTSRNVASNLVQTTVAQVKSFTLAANGAKVASPGQTVYYPHTITNTGNGTDSYALTAPVASGTLTHTSLLYYMDANSDGVPDNATPITSTGPLAAGAQFSFVVAGVVPSSATTAQTGTITVGATDSGSNTATNADTTTVASSVINVTEALSSTSGATGVTLTVTLSYTNSGTLDASTLTLSDTLPSGMTYVAGSGRWSGAGTTALTDASGGDTGIDYTFTGSTVKAIIPTVSVGMSGTVSFSVTIGAVAPTTSATVGLTTNTASFTTASQTVSTNTNAVTYTVRQNGAVVANNTAASASVLSAAKTTTVASAGQGATVTFTDYIWNTGNASDTFNVTLTPSAAFPAGTTFAVFQADGVTSLTDTNGDGVPDTGPLAGAASFTVVVKAYLPYGASTSGGAYTEHLIATSVFDPTQSNTVDNTLTAITANSVDLTSVAYAGAAAASGLGANTTAPSATFVLMPNSTASTQATFSLFVKNLGAVADSYTLSVTSAIPGGWSVAFASAPLSATDCSSIGSALTSTATIAAGASQLVCAVVTVPAAKSTLAPPGDQAFTFKVQSAVSAASDTLVDKVTVSTLHSVTLTPNGAQQTYPGSAVTYAHVLSNNGNVSEAVSYAGTLADSLAASGWTSVLYVGSVGTVPSSTVIAPALLPNTSVSVFVRVFPPGSATATSPVDVTTLTATYSGLSISATDATTVTDGLLLLKEQQTITCAGVATSLFLTTAIPNSAATLPGQCIGYRITATNMTAANITNVVVSDTVPANTTRYDGCGAPAATNGATLGGSATSTGAIGTVTASLTPLAPAAAFQLTFCTKINL